MMAKVHYWLVCDATSYIKSDGTDLQREALQSFENAYGRGEEACRLAVGETALERLAGVEAQHTDKFGDIAFAIRALPWGVKTRLTGLGWHKFTAFNHFINPFPLEKSRWSITDGYSYESSSKGGVDVAVVRGISDLLQGGVDPVHSLVVDRIGEYWSGGSSAWSGNLEENLAETVFAPWNVLARFYYFRFLGSHFDPLEVNGPNQRIVGLQLLGPVVHAAADACSLQHVRPALGLGHQVWENYLQAKVYNRSIGLEPEKVSHLLLQEPFSASEFLTQGQFAGAFDVQSFLLRLAAKTAGALQSSWAARSWSEIWEAGPDYWKQYLSSERMIADARLLYNQAVAGTVQIITHAFVDLVRAGVLDPKDGLRGRIPLPDEPLAQHDPLASAMRRASDRDTPSEETRQVPLVKAKDLLGFDPLGDASLQASLDEVNRCFAEHDAGAAGGCDLKQALTVLEDGLTRQFLKAAETRGSRFCPIDAMENTGTDADISAHFGSGTYRLPSEEECDDPERFRAYMEAVDRHEFKAHKIQLIQGLAAVRSYADRFGALGSWENQYQELLHRLREDIGKGLLDPGVDCAASLGALMGAAKDIQAESSRRAFSLSRRIAEWFGALFSFPVAAFATAALTLLVTVTVYQGGLEPPTGEISTAKNDGSTAPVMSLSTSEWRSPALRLMAPPPRSYPKSVQPQLPGLAVAVYLKNFGKTVPSEFVDGLYDAARPSATVFRKYTVHSPAGIHDAVTTGKIHASKGPDTAAEFGKALGVGDALFITVEKSGAHFNVLGERNTIASGAVRREERLQLTEEALPGEIGRMVDKLLEAPMSDPAPATHPSGQ